MEGPSGESVRRWWGTYSVATEARNKDLAWRPRMQRMCGCGLQARDVSGLLWPLASVSRAEGLCAVASECGADVETLCSSARGPGFPPSVGCCLRLLPPAFRAVGNMRGLLRCGGGQPIFLHAVTQTKLRRSNCSSGCGVASLGVVRADHRQLEPPTSSLPYHVVGSPCRLRPCMDSPSRPTIALALRCDQRL